MLHIFDIVVICCLNIINVETDRVLYDNIHLFTSLFCVLCTECCQCLWIVLSLLHLRYSLTFIYQSVLCLVYRMLSVSLDCLFFIASSVFSSVYLLVCSVYCVPNVVSVSGLSFIYCIFGILQRLFTRLFCVLCTECCQCLWIVFFYCIFGIL